MVLHHSQRHVIAIILCCVSLLLITVSVFAPSLGLIPRVFDGEGLRRHHVFWAGVMFLIVSIFVMKPAYRRKIRFFLIYTGYLLAILLCALGGGEIYLRYSQTSPQTVATRFPVGIERHPYPYIMFSGEPYKGDHNEYGFRGPAPSASKLKNEYRIFILGGSTVYNGHTPKHTIPGYLQTLFNTEFNEKSWKIHVYNWGVVASVSGMELARIIHQIVDHQPDMIIMYNGGNDAYHPYMWDPIPGYPMNFVIYEKNPLLEPQMVKTGYYLLSRSFLLKHFFFNHISEKLLNLDQRRKESSYLSLAWKQKIINTYLNNVRKSKIVSDGLKTQFFCFYQPLLSFKKIVSPQEQQFLGNKAFNTFLTEMRDILRSKLQQDNRDTSYFFDISDLFTDESDDIYTDIIHIRDPYHEVVARKIFETIQPVILEDIEQIRITGSSMRVFPISKVVHE